jgi:N-dimethylarginine dimethylaminohydrolase
MSHPRYLMCAPSYFAVDYVINPWMTDQIGKSVHSVAERQWNDLVRIIKDDCGAIVDVIEPVTGLPDMVFTANAGVVDGQKFVPARFHHPERQGEEPYFEKWFRENGFDFLAFEPINEGAGDMLCWNDILVCATGFRTDLEAHSSIGAELGREIVSLKLVNPSFYHLDTCFCPLPGNYVIWHPAAFDEDSKAKIEALVPASHRFEVNAEDAALFACNAVGLTNPLTGTHIVMGHCGGECKTWLESKGFQVHVTPLGEFLKAGGSAKCLTLRLDQTVV